MYYLLLLIYIGSQVHMYEVSEHCGVRHLCEMSAAVHNG
jgi:hypothetical protein